MWQHIYTVSYNVCRETTISMHILYTCQVSIFNTYIHVHLWILPNMYHITYVPLPLPFLHGNSHMCNQFILQWYYSGNSHRHLSANLWCTTAYIPSWLLLLHMHITAWVSILVFWLFAPFRCLLLAHCNVFCCVYVGRACISYWVCVAPRWQLGCGLSLGDSNIDKGLTKIHQACGKPSRSVDIMGLGLFTFCHCLATLSRLIFYQYCFAVKTLISS